MRDIYDKKHFLRTPSARYAITLDGRQAKLLITFSNVIGYFNKQINSKSIRTDAV